MLPMAVLTILPVMMSVDASLSRAAELLGAGPGQRFWRIYFPLTFPGVAAAWLLVFVSCLGFFITPALLGSADETMVTQLIIEQVQKMLNWRFAGALSFLLLVAAAIVFFLYDRTVGIRSLTQGGAAGGSPASQGAFSKMVGEAGRRVCAMLGRATDAVLSLLPAARHRASSGSSWNMAAVILLGAFLVLPTVFLIPVSFSKSSFIGWPPEGWSLQWYQEFFTSDAWTSAAVRSVVVAGCSAVLAMALGVPAAFALSSPAMPLRTAWMLLTLTPFFIPRIVIAIALFYLFAQLRLLDSSAGLILGHTVLSVPYVVITVMAVLNSYDFRLNHAAWTLGASRAQALRRITFPIIKAGLFSAFLFAFVTSFDDVTLALFLSAGTGTTLPKQMWADATMQVSPLLAAVSSVMLVVVTALILVAERMRSKTARLTEASH
jgi:ABC-type spermidine/putrescine transport system permease subunit II